MAAGLGPRLRGIRVYTWSPFETRAFGGVWYETRKKVLHHFVNISSTWSSMIPAFVGTFMTIKWAENVYHNELQSHRD